MSNQESRQPETWSLKDWKNRREAPFDLKQDDFSVDWKSSTSGIIEFRFVNGNDSQSPFRLEDSKFSGELPRAGRRFAFAFTVTGTGSRRGMQGDFFDLDSPSGPDPVASWGAEERGGGPILGQEGQGRRARRPETAAECVALG